jgi:Lon protease-like protein
MDVTDLNRRPVATIHVGEPSRGSPTFMPGRLGLPWEPPEQTDEVAVELPLFPLQTVLYPGLPIPLHVFEDRYRQMFARILEGERRFGVVAIVRGVDVDTTATYHPVGCVAEVGKVQRHADGRLDVVARGQDRFEIDGVVQAAPYIVAEVRTLPETTGEAAEQRTLKAGRLFTRYVAALMRMAGEQVESIDIPDDPVAASYLVAAGLQVDLADKQRLLTIPSAAERLAAEATLLRRELVLLEHLRVAGPVPMTTPFSLN